MWNYMAYRFPSEAAWIAALAEEGWQDGTPPDVALLVTGTVYEPGEGGAALPGWHVAAAFRDRAPPEAWAALAIDPPEGMPALAPSTPPSLSDYQDVIDAHVEAVAALNGYKSAASCAGYLNSTVPAWAAEAQAFIVWRDAVWVQVYSTLAAVQGGEPAPSISDLIADLPVMVWPEA